MDACQSVFVSQVTAVAYQIANIFTRCSASASLFDDASAALEEIFDLEKEPQALLFGYTHRGPEDKVSAPKHFAQEILPVLAQKKYTDLVLEVFPVGKPGSEIQRELDEFNRSGKIGRWMDLLIPPDDPDYKLVLEKAFELGMVIHGGGETFENKVVNKLIYKRNQQVVNEEIARNSKERMSRLMRQGKKEAWFGGCLHNDVQPPKENRKFSFGWSLEKLFPRQVVEVELVVPELSEQEGLYRYLALPPDCSWRAFIPFKGVNLVRNAYGSSYLLYWPVTCGDPAHKPGSSQQDSSLVSFRKMD